MGKHCSQRSKAISQAVLAAALTSGAPGANALSFEFGSEGEWLLDWDTNVAYTAQWRVAKPDNNQFRYKDTGDIVADSTAYAVLINANDGDSNFDRGKWCRTKFPPSPKWT